MRDVETGILLGLAASLLLWSATTATARAQEEALDEEAEVKAELTEGVDLLTQQVTQQEALLKTASTERERGLIQQHIRLLEKERRTLESLLHQLAQTEPPAAGEEPEQLRHPAEQLEQQQERWQQREEIIQDRQ